MSPSRSADIPIVAPDCASLQSTPGLNIYVLRDGGFDQFTFQDGRINQVKVGYEAKQRIPRNDPDVVGALDKQFPGERNRLPSGEMLTFPAARSADNRRFAAAVTAKRSNAPSEFVIRDENVLNRVSSLPGFTIESLAWSPRGDQLAALQLNFDNAARSASDVITPHGVQYSDVVLTVYAPSGQLTCQSVIAKKRRSAQSMMEWAAQ